MFWQAAVIQLSLCQLGSSTSLVPAGGALNVSHHHGMHDPEQIQHFHMALNTGLT